MTSTPYQTSAPIETHLTPDAVVGLTAADCVAFYGGTPIPQTNAALTNPAFAPVETLPVVLSTAQIANISTAPTNALTTLQVQALLGAIVPTLDGVVAALQALNIIKV